MDPPEWYNCNTPPPTPPLQQAIVNTPAPAPKPTTPLPTRSPVPDGKHRLLIAIDLDDSPTETGWVLTTLHNDESEEEVLYRIPIGTYSNNDKNQVFQYEVLVDSDLFYKLTIYDADGDGFGGTVVVIDTTDPNAAASDVPLVKEPGFTSVSGTSVTHGFYVGASTPQQYLTLNFQFDYFAHEVAYELKNDATGVIFALAWYHTFEADDVEASMIIPVYGPEWGDQTYTFRIWDDGADGICKDIVLN